MQRFHLKVLLDRRPGVRHLPACWQTGDSDTARRLFHDATRIGKWVHAEPIDLLVVVSEHAVA